MHYYFSNSSSTDNNLITEFNASYGSSTKMVTICITILFVAITFWALSDMVQHGFSNVIYMPVVLAVVYIGAYLYSPLKYSVTATELIIHRPIGKAMFKKADIISIGLMENGLPPAIRTFGVGGLFGYFGTFYSFDMGNMKWFVTRRDKCVIIKTSNNKKIVVSPDDAHRFSAAMAR